MLNQSPPQCLWALERWLSRLGQGVPKAVCDVLKLEHAWASHRQTSNNIQPNPIWSHLMTMYGSSLSKAGLQDVALDCAEVNFQSVPVFLVVKLFFSINPSKLFRGLSVEDRNMWGTQRPPRQLLTDVELPSALCHSFVSLKAKRHETPKTNGFRTKLRKANHKLVKRDDGQWVCESYDKPCCESLDNCVQVWSKH